MLLDMLAAVARKDFEDRRRRQMHGQAKAKAEAEGKYVGRPENKRRNARIATMLASGTSYSDVQKATGCSRATVAKIAKRVAALTVAARQYEIDAERASELAIHGMTVFEPAEKLAKQFRELATDSQQLRDKITFLWEHIQP
jgi:hypothetical protein